MKLTFAQNTPLRTYIIDSSNQILYKVNTPEHGSFTTIARKYSATPTSDTISEHTLVESQWYQLAQLCWTKPESSQIRISTLAQRQDNFKSVSREFVFTASDGRDYAWKLGTLGTGNPMLVLKGNPEEVLVTYHPNSPFRPAIRSHLVIVDREDVLCIQDEIILTFVLVQRCRRLMRESHLPLPQTWFSHGESRSAHGLSKLYANHVTPNYARSLVFPGSAQLLCRFVVSSNNPSRVVARRDAT